MTNVTVTITAGALSGVCTHAVGHTNYKVIPVPLTVTDTFLVSDIAASTFTLNVNAEDFEHDRTFTCILVVGSAPVTGSTLYCTAEDVQVSSQIQYTQLEYDSEDNFKNALTTMFIPRAMKLIDNYVGHNFQHNQNVTLTVDGSGKRILFIPMKYLPVISVSSVSIDGVDVTSGIKTYETYLRYDSGTFTKNAARGRNVSVTLTHGYTSIPVDVQFACAELIANALAELVRRKLMPDSMAQMMQGSGGSSALMQNPRVFTDELKRTLDEYKYSSFGVA